MDKFLSLLRTLWRPDIEEAETTEQAVIAKAANQLEVGEFQFLQLAYREWFGDDIPESAMDALFKSYMMDGEVPYWARQYARRIIRLDATGELNDGDPRYHRYDSEYRARALFDARSIGFALVLAVTVVGGGIALAEFEADPSTSMFPPYLSDEELRH